MSSFTARLELNTQAADVAAVVDQLADFHAAASHSPLGRVDSVITVQAEGLGHATITALGVVTDATGYEVVSVGVLPTDDVGRPARTGP